MRRNPETGDPDFFGFARDYLHTYLPKVQQRSPKTIQAYRISLECFLGYLADHQHVQREHVSFDHFDREHLTSWLAWMTGERGYAPNTVALRLTAVKAFLAYSAAEDITLVALAQAAKTLRAPTIPNKPIEYFTQRETRAVLAAFDGKTTKSRRNRMLRILLYDTAARAGELTTLTLQDLRLDAPGQVRLTGKGNKIRTVPLTGKTIEHLHVYLDEFHPNIATLPATQPAVLQPAPWTAHSPVSRHRRSRAQEGSTNRPRPLPLNSAARAMPHAAQDQSYGPLPAGHPSTDHHETARTRERLDHNRVLRLRDHRHDARSHQRRHASDQLPIRPPTHRGPDPSPLQPSIARPR